MTLWQVLVSEQSLDPLLDKLPQMEETELAALSTEAQNVLSQIAREGIGTFPAARVRAWVSSARLLALASLPGMGPARRASEHNIESEASRARVKIMQGESEQSQAKMAEMRLRSTPPLPSTRDDGTILIGGRRFVRVARGVAR